jgi:uncharacterized MAPEG superfamily protein
MPVELTALALAALLQVVQLGLYGVAANLQVGPAYSLGPRDEQRPLTGIAGRLQRALANHVEALILFAVAVVVVTLAGKASPLTAACAWAYLGARILYVPAYAFGWMPWRSLIWSVGFLATLIMLVAALH